MCNMHTKVLGLCYVLPWQHSDWPTLKSGHPNALTAELRGTGGSTPVKISNVTSGDTRRIVLQVRYYTALPATLRRLQRLTRLQRRTIYPTGTSVTPWLHHVVPAPAGQRNVGGPLQAQRRSLR